MGRRGNYDEKKMAAIKKYMCIHLGYMCKIWSFCNQGGLFTDHNDDAGRWHQTTVDDNDTRWKLHDCVGSLEFMPNEPITNPTISTKIIKKKNNVKTWGFF